MKDTEPNYQSFIARGLFCRGEQRCESNSVVISLLYVCESFRVANVEKRSQQAVYQELFKGEFPIGLCAILH